jgi:hypothetical protein
MLNYFIIFLTAGEIGFCPTPKEQPPRKLSGKWTVVEMNLWKADALFCISPKEQLKVLFSHFYDCAFISLKEISQVS